MNSNQLRIAALLGTARTRAVDGLRWAVSPISGRHRASREVPDDDERLRELEWEADRAAQQAIGEALMPKKIKDARDRTVAEQQAGRDTPSTSV